MILLDTHVLVWLALSPNKLSRNARNAILKSRMSDYLAVAEITLWELAWLVQHERIETPLSAESFVRECAARVRVLPISPEIAARAVALPEPYPKNPQDRLIGATALVEGLQLVTHDSLIRKSGIVPVVW